MNGLENLSERELLIKCVTNIENLCDNFEKLEEKNDKAHIEIFSVLRTKVSLPLFFWVIGFILFFIISVAGLTGAIKTDVTKNTTYIERTDKRGM